MNKRFFFDVRTRLLESAVGLQGRDVLNAQPKTRQLLLAGLLLISTLVTFAAVFTARELLGDWVCLIILSVSACTAGLLIHHLVFSSRSLGEFAQRPDRNQGRQDQYARDLISAMQDGVSILDTDGVHMEVNPAFCAMTGFSREELVGSGLPHKYWPPEEMAEIEAAFEATVREEGQEFELTFMRKGGERFPVTVSPAFLRDKSDKVIGYLATIKEISSYKRTQEMLRTTGRLAKIGSWEMNLKDMTPIWSEEVCRIHEVPLDFQPTLDEAISFYAPEYRPVIQAAVDHCIKTGTPWDLELQIITAKDRKVWVRAQGESVFIDGECVRLYGIFQNITSRKLYEQRLSESQRIARIGTWEWDIASGDIEWSSEMYHILGVNPASHKPSVENYADLVHPEDRALMNEGRLKANLARGTYTIENRVIHQPTEEIKYVQIWGHVTFDSTGSPAKVTGTLQDITDRKLAEFALRESQQQFESLFEASNVGMALINQEGRFVKVNEAAGQMLGYTAEQLLKLNFLDVTYHDDRESSEANFENAIERKKSYTIEKRYLTAEGEVMWGLTSVTPVFDVNGTFKYIISHLQNITQRKRATEEKARLELQLHRSQKMETIGTLAGGIAHDFNNLLAPILGYTEIVLDSMAPDDPHAGDLKNVMQFTLRARDLVEQILLFGKQIEKDRHPLYLQKVVDEALILLRPSIPTTIDIVQNISQDCGLVLADSTQMHQVIVNLCTNAWHAIEPEQGLLTIELKPAQVDDVMASEHPNLKPGDYVRLSVIDTGCGMDAETQTRLFEPFYTTKEVDRGTGLGLSVVHGIVQSHQGEIMIESKVGQGSAFHLYLPMVRAEAAVETGTEDTPSAGKERILVVDDNDSITELVERMLVKFGYEVMAMTSSAEAADLLRQQAETLDLVLTDLTMPHMTGLELAEIAAQANPELPVMIMTGHGNESLTGKDLTDSNIHKVMQKPLTSKALVGAIRDVLDREKAELISRQER